MYVYMCVYIYIDIYMYISVCAYILICICICIYIYIYIYTSKKKTAITYALFDFLKKVLLRKKSGKVLFFLFSLSLFFSFFVFGRLSQCVARVFFFDMYMYSMYRCGFFLFQIFFCFWPTLSMRCACFFL